MRAVLSVLVLIVTTVACSGGTDSVEGYWLLESLGVAGDDIPIVEGETTSGMPWVFIGDHLEGSAGCNGFYGRDAAIDPQGDRLHPGQVIVTARLCSGPEGADGSPDRSGGVMTIERILTTMLWTESERGIEVGVADGIMTWTVGPHRAHWSRLDGPPQPPPPEPMTSIGPLDCAPGVVVEDHFEGSEHDPLDLLFQASPDVTRYTHRPPFFWTGYDAAGRVVAHVAEGDIRPPKFQVFTCSG